MKLIKTVQNDNLANAMGSGTLPVLATPQLVAWMEEACWKSLDLTEGQSSVGYFFEISHLKPSLPQSEIVIESQITEQSKNKVSFSVTATHDGILVAKATHKRAIVEIKSFMEGAIKG